MSFERRDTINEFLSGHAMEQTTAAYEARAREQVRSLNQVEREAAQRPQGANVEDYERAGALP